VIVFFEDEARFGRISREMACWVRADMIPTVARQMIREYIYAYAAISPQTGDCYSMISPYCNTEAMNEFLSQLSLNYSNYRIIMILDKAGWHQSLCKKVFAIGPYHLQKCGHLNLAVTEK
jgi:putative transposase